MMLIYLLENRYRVFRFIMTIRLQLYTNISIESKVSNDLFTSSITPHEIRRVAMLCSALHCNI